MDNQTSQAVLPPFSYFLRLAVLTCTIAVLFIGMPASLLPPKPQASLVFLDGSERPLFREDLTSSAMFFWRKEPPLYVRVVNPSHNGQFSFQCVAKYPINKKVTGKTVTQNAQTSGFSYMLQFPDMNDAAFKNCSLIRFSPSDASSSWLIAPLQNNLLVQAATANGLTVTTKALELDGHISSPDSGTLVDAETRWTNSKKRFAKGTAYTNVFSLKDDSGDEVLNSWHIYSKPQLQLACKTAKQKGENCGVVNGALEAGLEQVLPNAGALDFTLANYSPSVVGKKSCNSANAATHEKSFIFSTRKECKKVYASPPLRVAFQGSGE